MYQKTDGFKLFSFFLFTFILSFQVGLIQAQQSPDNSNKEEIEKGERALSPKEEIGSKETGITHTQEVPFSRESICASYQLMDPNLRIIG
jgi:hypothetical protein